MNTSACPDCGHSLTSECLFCPKCGRDLQQPLKCPKCGYANESNSKFCQECGRPLGIRSQAPHDKTTRPRVVPAEIPPPPSTGITIEFRYSTSQSFEFAVAYAAKHASFAQFGDAKRALYRVAYDRTDLESVAEMAEHLKGWRNRAVYVDGEKVTWKSVFDYLWCYRNKQASYKPEYYCFGYENEWQFNIWGCVQCGLPFIENADWFCWGRFVSKQADWEFDKARIRHELEKNLHSYRFCPALDGSRVLDVLSAFPEKVNPQKDKNWQFAESWGDYSGSGLLVKVKRYGFTDEVTVKGVSPSGRGALKDIGKRLKFRLPGA
jgi:hypothetical protein